MLFYFMPACILLDLFTRRLCETKLLFQASSTPHNIITIQNITKLLLSLLTSAL